MIWNAIYARVSSMFTGSGCRYALTKRFICFDLPNDRDFRAEIAHRKKTGGVSR